MKTELKLQTGRMVMLRELRQYGTYEGLLNGLPTKERNQKRLAHLIEEEGRNRYNTAPYLIEPAERTLELPKGDVYPFGTPSALPAVTCICRLESFAPTPRGTGDASGLVVIWFQNVFQYPPPGEIDAQLKAIDWDGLAGNFEY